jgi:hypothetical protein
MKTLILIIAALCSSPSHGPVAQGSKCLACKGSGWNGNVKCVPCGGDGVFGN